MIKYLKNIDKLNFYKNRKKKYMKIKKINVEWIKKYMRVM